NPKVYTDDGLRTLLRVFLSEFALPVRKEHLQQLFELLLTPWTVSVLGLDETVDYENPDLSPEEQTVVNAAAARITASWSEREVVIFRHKLGNLPDAQLARRLGVSRPTAANAKSELFARLADELSDLERHLRPAVLTEIASLTSRTSS